MKFNRYTRECNKCGERNNYKIVELDVATFIFLFITYMFFLVFFAVIGINLGLAMTDEVETFWQTISIVSITIAFLIGNFFGKINNK